MTVTRLAFAAPALPDALPVRLVFGETEGPPEPPADSTVSLVARVTRLRGAVNVVYESNTPRLVEAIAASAFNVAVPVQRSFVGAWQSGQALGVVRSARWRDGQRAQGGLRGAWSDADRSARRALVAAFSQALPVDAWSVLAAWQQALRTRGAVAARYQQAQGVAAWPVASAFEQAQRQQRVFAETAYQRARTMLAAIVETASDANTLRTPMASRYQDARRPPIGRWLRPVVPPAPEPCYVPELPVRLVFTAQSGTGLPLVFVCERHAAPSPNPGTVVVPVRRVYMTTNNLTLTRVSDGASIPAYTFGMALDADSWTWSWQATLHASALPLIQPGPGGDPVDVLATINGAPYRLCVEQYGRQREFASTRISVRGRGRAAILDAPYAPTLNHGNTLARTAQQLMGEVLTINGVGIGWDVDFGLEDWLVPGNVWTHQGSYISAILEIAAAAGGYVQPHDTAATLRILPRYPAAPWDWAGLTPGFELPADAVSVEGIEWQRKAPYNRVYVSGTTAGVLGEVTRGGTAGEVVAPMVTDSLITHADAARQRGRAVLSDTGTQAHISLRLPVLDATGVIPPGALVRYVDGATTHLGLVRATSLEWQAPKLRQTLAVETHPA